MELGKYRQQQRAIAMFRDNGLCVACWFWDRKKTKAIEVHHVFGRGRSPEDHREHYSRMMSVCRKHHPEPISHPDDNPEYFQLLLQLNETPINHHFSHSEKNLNVVAGLSDFRK